MEFRLIISIFGIAITLFSFGQKEDLSIKEVGMPFIRNYESPETGGLNQNWAAIEDSLGVMHFGNQIGLLTFDGTDWDLKQLENREAVAALCADDTGMIFYGTNADFGYFKPDSLGNVQVVSLVSLLPQDAPVVGNIVNVDIIGDQVFFHSPEGLYVYSSTLETVIPISERGIYRPFVYKNTYHVFTKSGVSYYEDGSLLDLDISPDISLSRCHPIEIDGQLIFYHQTNKSYLYDHHKFIPFDLKLDVSQGASVRFVKCIGDYFVVGTSNVGLEVFDKSGRRILQLNNSTGVSSNSIYDFYIDRFKNLWLMHENGISKVEWHSAYSLIDKRYGLNSPALYSGKHHGYYYVATYDGYYRVRENLLGLKPFERITSGKHTHWLMREGKEDHMVGHGGGVSQLKGDELVSIHKTSSISYAIAFSEDEQHMLVGTKYDFYVLKKQGSDWVFHSEIKNFHQFCDFIINIEGNQFWMSNSGSGLWKLELNEAMDSLRYQFYDESSGLPSIYNNRIFAFDDDVIFATAEGVYNYDKENDRFEKNASFSNLMEDGWVFRFIQSPEGDIWFVYVTDGDKRGVLHPTDSGYRKEFLPYPKLEKYSNHNLNPIDTRNTLVSSPPHGLLHIDPSRPFINDTEYKALITEVRSLVNDSLVNGTYYKSDVKPRFESDQTDFRFSFSATCYDEPEKTHFQWRLKGYENSWSSIQNTRSKDYTNLDYGKYTFEVRASNVYGRLSEVAQYHFTIRSPWYLLWWAWVIYGFLFVGFLVLLVKFNSLRLRRENARLEKTIKERIKEIQEQKTIITEQAQGLEKSLRERESLLKEIHHRVKNNLQIIASLLYLQSGKFENEDFKKVLEEGQGRVRSMALIHQKLYENDDLKSIPFGEYLTELLSEIKASFGHTMEKVKLDIQADDVQFDVETAVPLGLIVNELATNAFKYAFDGIDEGTFSISLRREQEQYVLNIADNGKGIPEEIDIKKTRSLGLRLVKMLSVQLEGEYAIEAKEGTMFELKFAA
ncbi:MAG: histidine kinase dimerization/phosphoacceptor domain -containing protein [Cyclobacteriaceae bacterium]